MDRAHQAVGNFLAKYAVGDMDGACKFIEFKKVCKLFNEQGMSKNASDQACASWLYEILARPMLEFLQCGDAGETMMDKKINELQRLTDAFSVRALQDSALHTQPIVDAMKALKTLMGTASSSPPAPMEVRAALSFFADRPPKDPINLALKHSIMGKALFATSKDQVKQSEKDTMADTKLEKATQLISNLLATEHPKDFTATFPMLAEVQMCLGLWTKIGFERRYDDAMRFVGLVRETMSQWEDALVKEMSVLLRPVSQVLATEMQTQAVATMDGLPTSAPLGPTSATGSDNSEGAQTGAAVDQLALAHPLQRHFLSQEVLSKMGQEYMTGRVEFICNMGDLHDYTCAACKLEENMRPVAQRVGKEIGETIAQQAAGVNEKFKMVQNLFDLFDGCCGALGEPFLQVTYETALAEWSTWSIAGDMRSKSLQKPMLLNLVEATDRACKLKSSRAWADFETAPDNTELKSLMNFDDGPVIKFIFPLLRKRMSSLFSDALVEVSKVLYTHGLALRSKEEIEQMAQHKQLPSVASNFFSDGESVVNRLCNCFEDLETQWCGLQRLFESPIWPPHSNTVRMAQQFLNITQGAVVEAARVAQTLDLGAR